MKLTALEIERARRVADRSATLERIKLIDDRIQAITEEQETVKALLEQAADPAAPASATPPQRKNPSQMNLRY